MSTSQTWSAVRFAICAMAAVLFVTSPFLAQTTISTGSIVGTVTDPSGAVVSGAKVTITNRATGQVISTTTTSTGTYASGALTPGNYQVRVEGQGFKTTELPVTVQVNTTASGNLKLEVGQSAQVVEVQASDVAVNTEQATVQGVLTSEQIENLPINGRNFLDLAQLEPGVQIQDGGTFDPTKNGFSSVSFGGRFGRTARIEVDGVDISDETVGTTTQNLPLGAIQESSLQQSSLDLSTELTSSGSVNVSTKSGTNAIHGEGFYAFRDQSLNANLPGASTNPFQRNQFGGDLGGPIVKDKMFFFLDAERTKQDLLDPVIPGAPFNGVKGSFTSPFRETETMGRIDWQPGKYKVFYRFTYDQNKSVLPFIPNSFQPFANVDHARGHIVGVDFGTGTFTHSFRFGYSKFENGIKDAVTGSPIFNPAPGIELAIGNDPNCLTAGVDAFCSGPNFLAPQATMQSNKQIKYDGSRAYKNHIFRFGAGFDHIQGGGFAEFLALAPAVGAFNAAPPCVAANNCPFPALVAGDPAGAADNPLNYPATNVKLGNGQGFSSEKAAFGLPGGGLGPDNRFSWYVGDSWKIKPTFTLTLGLRYVRDTGRTDSDIGPIAALDQFNYSNQFFTYRGLGSRVRQPNMNLAPQLGFAWDTSGKGKTVVRGGVGLFYENSIWNNNLFDRPARLQQGLFLGQTEVCSNGIAQSLPFSSSVNPSSICLAPIGTVTSQITTLQQEYQAATLAAGPQSNGAYIGNTLADGIDVTGTNLFAPNYITPRSVQMNIGIQQEIRRGTVLTVDLVRNVATHNLLSIDTNHVGDFRTLAAPGSNGIANAQAAIATAIANCGRGTTVASTYSGNCPNDPATGTLDPDPITSVPTWVPRPANISDYAKVGLDSGYGFCGGGPCPKAAFPGFNPNVGTNQMLFPIGRSVYNGLQMTLKQDVSNPVRGIKHMNLQISYALSRYVSSARDNDFINFPYDNANPLKYLGPNGLDRTHQISFGGWFDLPAHFRMSLVSHFDSPLPLDVRIPTTGSPGGIFQTDITGDGTGDGTGGSNGGNGDLLPGTKEGSFGRDFGTNGLKQKISAFNTAMVGQLTPAGQALVTNSVMSQADLVALGGTIGGGSTITQMPAGAVGMPWLRTFDVGLNWAYKIKESVEIRPSVTLFNVFNFSNFAGPAAPFTSTLTGLPGSANGTTSALLHGDPGNGLRLGLGSGVNSLGAPRALEFQLKLSF